MISAAEYLRRIQTLTTERLEGFVDEIIISDTKTLTDEKIREFTYGEMPDGDKIGIYRDAEYAFFKKEINPLANGYVDLMLSRSFINGLHLDKTRRKTYTFNSTDWKRDILINKYGIDIMGLNYDYWINRQKDIYKIPFVQMIKTTAKIA
jgi:hypothetical protein